MVDLPSPFSGRDDDVFDEYDEFVPDHLPRPGRFLEGHDVLRDEDHVAFHDHARAVFEERGVYDMTFGYNLARLNLDQRHPGAGYRYAREKDDDRTIRAEFTPTTPFCPQSHTLTIGSFRAWNGVGGDEYDLVRVRVAEMHQRSDEINDELEGLEAAFLETGTVERDGSDADGPTNGDDGGPFGRGDGGRGSVDAPF